MSAGQTEKRVDPLVSEKNSPGDIDRDRKIERALIRARIYQLLSSALLYPEEELLSALKEGTFFEELGASISYLLDGKEERGDVLWAAIESLKEIIKAEITGHPLSDFQEKYIRVFGHIAGKDCPPYETQYGVEHIFQKTQELGDIAGFYRAFGLEVSDTLKERLDHISVELEFMHFLAVKEAYALKNHSSEKVQVCVDAQKKFMREHLGMWGPLFAILLGKKAGKGFYKDLSEVVGGFLAWDVANLGVKPKKLSKPEPMAEDFDDTGCSFPCGMEESENKIS